MISLARSTLFIAIAFFLSAFSCTGVSMNRTDSSKDACIYVNGTELHRLRVCTSYDEPSVPEFTQTNAVNRTRSIRANVNASEKLTIRSSNGRSWCVAKQHADPDSLQAAIDWVCGIGAADCRPMQPGYSCFVPNTVFNHASYAFNSYYQIRQHASGTCDFDGVATVTYEDPSYAGCPFPFREGQVGANADGADVKLSLVIATCLLVSLSVV